MVNIQDLIRQLASNVHAIHALVETVPDVQAQWKPDTDTWCLTEVMGHIYNEERGDFRPHIKGLLSDPSQPWEASNQPWVVVEDFHQALEGFITERQASIAWLKTLESPDWNVKAEMTFGPANEPMTLSAGDVLVSWVEHDYLHIRQINELLHAWNAREALPYSVDYAGGW
ncbi:MAG: DinB family protein [Anaerolineae bacterium]